MNRRSAAWTALCAALALAAVLTALGEAKKKSVQTGILRSRSAGIAANHALHLSDAKLGCTACHAGAAGSKSSADYLVPSNKACQGCHPGATCKGALLQDCKGCHVTKPSAYSTLRVKHKNSVEIVFPHAKHLPGDPDVESCKKCHSFDTAAQPQPGKKASPGLPDMRLCLDCHRHRKQYEALLCGTCHFTDKDGTLETHLSGALLLKPPAWMSGMKHGALWFKEHEAAAANHSSLCAACHVNEDCDRCHAGAGQAMPQEIHKDDWIMMHGQASMAADLHCSSCHNLQNFCLPCHRRSGVAWDSPPGLNIPSGSVFHPEGWYSYPGPGKMNKHAIQARQSLPSCVSCHTEYDCMLCHAAPFAAMSPHPPPSIWHAKCKTLYEKNPDVCFKCHTSILSICR
jgi:hypothetical protein